LEVANPRHRLVGEDGGDELLLSVDTHASRRGPIAQQGDRDSELFGQNCSRGPFSDTADVDSELLLESVGQHRVELDGLVESELEIGRARALDRNSQGSSKTGDRVVAEPRAPCGADQLSMPMATNPASIPRSSARRRTLRRISMRRRR